MAYNQDDAIKPKSRCFYSCTFHRIKAFQISNATLNAYQCVPSISTIIRATILLTLGSIYYFVNFREHDEGLHMNIKTGERQGKCGDSFC